MGVKIGTCSVCRAPFEQALRDGGMPDYDKKVVRGRTVFTVNIPGDPKSWPKNSLRSQCWNQLNLPFAFHGSSRTGDMIHCPGF